MVGELTYNDDTRSRTTFMIADDNCMVSGGFFTEGGLLENIAQTAAARVGYKAKLKMRLSRQGISALLRILKFLFYPLLAVG